MPRVMAFCLNHTTNIFVGQEYQTAVMSDTSNSIGQDVREARKSANMTQAQLANELDMNVSRQEISAIERGHVTRYVQILEAIANRFGIEIRIGNARDG